MISSHSRDDSYYQSTRESLKEAGNLLEVVL